MSEISVENFRDISEAIDEISKEIEVANSEDEKDLICAPLQTLDELINWNVSTHPNWARKVIPKEQISSSSATGKDVNPAVYGDWRPITRCRVSSVPKTLFCHDYKGGYKEDRFVNGSNKYDEYRFFHWAGIDTFVYFSHHFITIPPLAWINSAHRHGVKVLGTIITEWTDGMDIWDRILTTKESIDQIVNNLVSISVYFGFEGYLLNIENEIKKTTINLLEYFIVTLRRNLLVHIPEAEVIWYDSVTIEGQLKWQNTLNENNKRWFDASDGIFLNYGWREDELRKSLKAAGVRAHDVYVGVDVFGRGVYGGGGFNSDKAMSAARAFGLSVAVFAPGWVHETHDVAQFAPLEYLFWAKLWPFLYPRGPTKLPFTTSFCQGFGLATYVQGAKTPGPWYNLALQAYQPTVPSDLNEASVRLGQLARLPAKLTRGCVQHCADDAFEGGGCLRLQPPNNFSVDGEAEDAYLRLFLCSFKTENVLLVTCAWKSESGNPDVCPLSLVLIVQESTGRYSKMTLSKDTDSSIDCSNLIADDAIEIMSRCPDVNPNGNNGWRHSLFAVELKKRKLVEIGANVRGSVLLGQLRLLPVSANMDSKIVDAL